MFVKHSQSVRPGSVVLVTAGASGIGRTIAESFLASDCRVHVCDIDREAVKRFLGDHPSATATRADVSDPRQVDRVFEDLGNSCDGLDVLVNNAGISGPVMPAEEVEPEAWDETLAVNLNSHFYFARRAIPLLRKAGGGSIVMIGSTAAFYGCPLRAPYAASKWGLLGLTKTLAMELGPDGIRVNAICPGSVDGERIRRVMELDARKQGKTIDEMQESYLDQNSMRVFVDAEDVANMVLYLVSDLGAKISGQALGIDGNTISFA